MTPILESKSVSINKLKSTVDAGVTALALAGVPRTYENALALVTGAWDSGNAQLNETV